MFRQVMDYLRYIQTWVWVWSIVSTSSVAVVIWAFITRLPGVVVFVLALGTGALMLIALETALIVHDKINERLGARYWRAVVALDGLRTKGVVLRNRPVTSDAELRTFSADLAAFQGEALAAMQGAATRTDIAWFRDLHEWTVTHGVSAYNNEHAILKATLDEKLRRVYQIAGKLEARVKRPTTLPSAPP
jgi:hypothetical protein